MSKDVAVSNGLLACFLGFSALVGCNRAKESEVKAATVVSAPLQISCLGRIVAGDGALKIAGPSQAIVSELRVHRGSHIVRGDILAVLQDNKAATASLREAEQQIAVAESLLQQAKAPEKPGTVAAQNAALARQEVVLENARADDKRKKALFAEKLISLAEMEASETNFKSAQEGLRHEKEVLSSLTEVRDVDVDLASKRVAAAAATRDRALIDVERTIVRAPAAGTVLEIFARAGEAIQADQGILDLGDTDHIFVEAEVYANDFPRVREGASAVVSGEAFLGSRTGVVSEILSQVGPSSLFPTDPLVSADKRVIKVRILLQPNSGLERLSGSQVDVRIQP